jgi:hypothetical protein
MKFIVGLSVAALLTFSGAQSLEAAKQGKRRANSQCHACVAQCNACGWTGPNCQAKCRPRTLLVRKDSLCIPGQQFSTRGC